MNRVSTVERKSECEIVVTRTINGSVPLVYAAWTKSDWFAQWWVPKSTPISLLSCEMDVRVGGGYRLVFDVGAGNTMAFYGQYLEVTPAKRLVWTNDEGGPENASTTTVTFAEHTGGTLVVLHEQHPSKEALEAALATGSADCMGETFDQLDAFIGTQLSAT
jgi:uncharacterized protein YndB with AHSA1/START domain